MFLDIREAFFLGRQVREQGVSKLEGRVERDGSRDAEAVPDGVRVGRAALAVCRPGLAGSQDDVLIDVLVALLLRFGAVKCGAVWCGVMSQCVGTAVCK